LALVSAAHCAALSLRLIVPYPSLIACVGFVHPPYWLVPPGPLRSQHCRSPEPHQTCVSQGADASLGSNGCVYRSNFSSPVMPGSAMSESTAEGGTSQRTVRFSERHLSTHTDRTFTHFETGTFRFAVCAELVAARIEADLSHIARKESAFMRESWVLSGIRLQLGKAPSPLARCSTCSCAGHRLVGIRRMHRSVKWSRRRAASVGGLRITRIHSTDLTAAHWLLFDTDAVDP
jgi:hypothetical protein